MGCVAGRPAKGTYNAKYQVKLAPKTRAAAEGSPSRGGGGGGGSGDGRPGPRSPPPLLRASSSRRAVVPKIDMGAVDASRRFKVEHFDIGRCVGRGAYSHVFVATHKSSGRVYALKRASKDWAVEKEFVDVLDAERRVLRALKSPFCIRSYGTMQDSKYVYLVLDFCQCGELYSLMREPARKRMPEPVARFFLAEILMAVDHVHVNGFIYRDLKPENIVIAADGHIRLIDYNCAVRADRAFDVVGTPQYRAPEMIEKDTGVRGYTKAVDYWAFGCLLYEMLAGKALFGLPRDRTSFVHAIIKVGPKSPPPSFSPAAADLYRKLVTVDPRARLCKARTIAGHPFFVGVDWDALSRCELATPYKERFSGPLDTRCFEEVRLRDETVVADESSPSHGRRGAGKARSGSSKFAKW